MRESAGLTLEGAAPKLELSKSALGRIETGETQVTVHIVRSMMDLYQSYDEGVMELVREARQPGWWQGYRIANLEYLAWETCAQRVRQLAVARIPDLLQTEPYAQAWLAVDRCEEPDPHTLRRLIDHEVWSRGVRQRRFADEDTLGLTVVITETALRHRVAGSQVMVSQWRHLAQAANWPAVTLRVLPDRAGARTLCTSGFSVVEFADPADAQQLYVDGPFGLLRVDTPYRIKQAQLRFVQLCAASLSPLESIEFIECLARDVPDSEFASVHAFVERRLVASLASEVQSWKGDRACNLCFAGGCALNIKWNSALRSSGLFTDVWVPPFRCVSRFLRQGGQGFIESTEHSDGVSVSSGLLIQAAMGSSDGSGCLRTNRSGLRV